MVWIKVQTVVVLGYTQYDLNALYACYAWYLRVLTRTHTTIPQKEDHTEIISKLQHRHLTRA